MVIKSRENLWGAWAFSIGVGLSLLVGIIVVFTGKNLDPSIVSILALLGLIAGYFVAEKDVQTFLFAAVSLVLVSWAGMNGLVMGAAIMGVNISKLITSTMGALLMLFVPATIIVSLKMVFSIAKR
jgi:hypothetical protein